MAISYQSKRRCSKTPQRGVQYNTTISYQSKRRCSKTGNTREAALPSDQLPVKTTLLQNRHAARDWSELDQLPVKTTLLQNRYRRDIRDARISYQSKRRCSKTPVESLRQTLAISYQSKRRCSKTRCQSEAKTTQISYQSKRRCSKTRLVYLAKSTRSATSQNDAAPKL